jgi:putative oxidoreductase
VGIELAVAWLFSAITNMQRLFSTFPNGWPGTGLLLLRFTAGLYLVIGELSRWSGFSESTILALRVARLSAGLLLMIGLWTPVVGVAQAIVEVWIGIGERSNALHVFVASIASSLSMLGPGAWSADARLFGRKRIDV